jgi:hypothetical protein
MKTLKNNLSHRAWHARLALSLAAMLCGPGALAFPFASAKPTTVAPAAIGKFIAALPDYARFSLEGLAFYGERLYVPTNVGLFEIQGATPTAIYQWHPREYVLEGAWYDEANQALWIDQPGISLLKLDATSWQREQLPKPPMGSYHGYIVPGTQGVSGTTGFRIVGGGHIWARSASGEWMFEATPPMPSVGATAGIGFVQDDELIVTRTDVCAIEPCTYAGYWRERNGWSAPQDLPLKRLRQTVGTPDGVFLRDASGELARVTRQGATHLASPGRSDALARTSAGKLIASFIGVGVFQFDDGKWSKLLDAPPDASEGEHRAFLAERHGALAYATASVAHTDAATHYEKTRYTGMTAIWVAKDRAWVRVKIAD